MYKNSIFGLMFKKPKTIIMTSLKESIFFSSIHTFFVFKPIDVIWLDNQYTIVDYKTVKPFKLNVKPKKPAKYIVESYEGFIKKNKIKIGEKFEYKNRV
ncbi:MAG: DUF192 domain-containing protein [Candidatus Woesearchaeota archaeon]